jgi:hypothetical protein
MFCGPGSQRVDWRQTRQPIGTHLHERTLKESDIGARTEPCIYQLKMRNADSGDVCELTSELRRVVDGAMRQTR